MSGLVSFNVYFLHKSQRMNCFLGSHRQSSLPCHFKDLSQDSLILLKCLLLLSTALVARPTLIESALLLRKVVLPTTSLSYLTLQKANRRYTIPIPAEIQYANTTSSSPKTTSLVIHGERSQPSNSPMASLSTNPAQSAPISPANTPSLSSPQQQISKLAHSLIKHSL